ncbi:alpha/beta hydrolase [Kribbella speibonae]|uniref:Alpha/beta hydrolase n=1 Tax=Kribbella speibonae TaxID=1572660 RepID=A0A4R0IQ50_9ACTN|nr:alpha/beta hydrolase [Kribbella speibonae]
MVRPLGTVLVSAGLLLAGCSGPSTPQSTGTPSTSQPSEPSSPSPSPSVELSPLAERCGVAAQPAATPRVIKVRNDVQLYSAAAGSGKLGVVLVHGSGSRGICNWANEIGWLAKAGLNVVAYDQTCIGASTCANEVRPIEDLLAVVADLRKRGATQVVVVGASAGGSIPLIAAARPNSGITAAVSLSTAGLTTPLGTADAPNASATSVARTISQPVLYVLARDDTASSVPEITSISKTTPRSRLLLLPAGSGHAQQALYTPDGQSASAFRQTFLTFLRAPST